MLKGSTNAEKIWYFCKDKGLNNFGAASILANLDAESRLDPCNMEDYYQRKLGMTDAQYTDGVIRGTYPNFVNDSVGYGICQWTWHTRKQALYDFWKTSGAESIGDLEMQLNFLFHELSTNYRTLLNILKTATSLSQATIAFLTQFEVPANAESLKAKRVSMSNTYYQRFVSGQAQAQTIRLLLYGCEGEDVKALQEKLIQLGYSCGSLGADGQYGSSTLNAVKKLQRDNGLKVDGIVGSSTLRKIDSLINSLSSSVEKVIVTANALNVRTGAGINYHAVSYVRKGTICELVEKNGAWGKIKQPEGWICLDYTIEI